MLKNLFKNGSSNERAFSFNERFSRVKCILILCNHNPHFLGLTFSEKLQLYNINLV